LDSKSDHSKLIGEDDKLRQYLDNQLKSKEKEIFVVVDKEVLETESWMLLKSEDIN